MNVVMLIEDNATDVKLIKHAFSESSIELRCIATGEECLAYLQSGIEALPSLVILDLSLPKMGGREVLERIKTDDEIRHLPVIILTGYAEAKDVKRQWQTGCAAYFVKPHDYDELARLVRMIRTFYFNDHMALPGGVA